MTTNQKSIQFIRTFFRFISVAIVGGLATSAHAATFAVADGESVEGTIRCTTQNRVYIETGDQFMTVLKKKNLTDAGTNFVAGWEEANSDWSYLPVKFDRVPDLKYRVQPDRSKIENAANQVVMIALLLNEDGSVQGAFIRDSTDGRLNSPTIEAVSRWKFSPAELNSAPTRSVISIPVQF